MVYKGIKIEDNSQEEAVDLSAVAPAGKVFAVTGTHSVVSCVMVGECEYSTTPKKARSLAIKLLKADIDFGFEECSNLDCEECNA
jgi:hypothetical protein